MHSSAPCEPEDGGTAQVSPRSLWSSTLDSPTFVHLTRAEHPDTGVGCSHHRPVPAWPRAGQQGAGVCDTASSQGTPEAVRYQPWQCREQGRTKERLQAPDTGSDQGHCCPGLAPPSAPSDRAGRPRHPRQPPCAPCTLRTGLADPRHPQQPPGWAGKSWALLSKGSLRHNSPQGARAAVSLSGTTWQHMDTQTDPTPLAGAVGNITPGLDGHPAQPQEIGPTVTPWSTLPPPGPDGAGSPYTGPGYAPSPGVVGIQAAYSSLQRASLLPSP